MVEINYKNLDKCESYKKLQELNGAQKISLKKELTADRVKAYSTGLGKELTFNYAAKSVSSDVISVLQQLSEEQQLIDKYKELLRGVNVNTGEDRKVLHHLVRGQIDGDVIHNGRSLRTFYKEQQKNIANFAEKVHSGEIKGSTGKVFDTVVQIGIGGSDLGPRALYISLKDYVSSGDSKQFMNAHFISNVDPDDAQDVLLSINPETTLFILVSKSGTTQETLANETFVRKYMQAKGLNPDKHMIAVTSETSPLANSPRYLASFYIDDYIGGRYSSTSAVGGAVLTLAFGSDIFDQFLMGAHDVDLISLEKDITNNAPLLDALIGVWERNILEFQTTAVLPYSQALSRFPAHLQQLDMESNGKSVNRFNEPINYKTGPIVFGEPGTNGQHSFYQLLHQGTDIVPLQFIAFEGSQIGADVEVDGSTSQSKLKANCVAQIVAFATGKEDTNSNKYFAGERPSSLIYGKRLTPYALGSLLAHYENKVMFQGFIWNINSFDQEGVQLGKVLTKKVLGPDLDDPVLKAYASLLSI